MIKSPLDGTSLEKVVNYGPHFSNKNTHSPGDCGSIPENAQELLDQHATSAPRANFS